jgi:hypothetical protein
MLTKALEEIVELKEGVDELRKELPEQLHDLNEELGQIHDSVRDKSKDKKNYGIGGEV